MMHKRTWEILLLILAVFFLAYDPVYAADDSVWQNDYTYSLEGSYIKVSVYNGDASELTLPASAIIGGKKYTSYIAANGKNSPWAGDQNLGSLTIESGVKCGKNLSCLFSGCSSLCKLDLSGLDTTGVTNMNSMFQNCSSLAYLNLKGMNTSGVASMNYMFSGCSALTSLNLADFDCSGVITMNNMFSGCSSLLSLNLSGLDTSHVMIMNNMFSGCSALKELDLSKLDTSSVMFMSSMFQDCSSLKTLNISGFTTDSVSLMSYMFYGCKSLTGLDLSHFNTSSVMNMVSMFEGCSSLKELDLSAFSVSSSDTSSLCRDCSSLEKVTLPEGLNQIEEYSFCGCKSLKEITIEDTVTRIGEGAFLNAGLETITLTNDDVSLANHCLGFTLTDQTYEKVEGFSICANPESRGCIYARNNGLGFLCISHTEKILPAVEPTEDTTGLTEGLICSVCGYVIKPQTTIPELKHIHRLATLPAVPATEESEGLTEGVWCSKCGEILVAQKVVPKLEHVHVEEVIPGVPATEESTGLTEGVRCSKCGEILVAQEVIPKLAHVHVPEVMPAVEPTTTSTGLTEGLRCSKCGEILVPQEVIPKITVEVEEKDGANHVVAGKKLEIKVEIKKATIKKVVWKSSNKKYASVKAKGKKGMNAVVKAKKSGKGHKVTLTAKITYVYEGSDKASIQGLSSSKKASIASTTRTITKKYNIIIPKTTVRSIRISGSSSVKVGKSIKLKAKTSPSVSSTRLKWVSSNKRYAYVSSAGRVYGKKAGKKKKVKITCIVNDKSGKKASKTVWIK